MTLRTAHTAGLAPGELDAIRALLDDAFDGDFGDEDWDHTLGGVHALVHDARGLAAHGAVVMRRVRYRTRWLRTGYVEGVAVRRDVRRQGFGGAVMGALEEIVTRAYDLGALSASEDGAALYAARGWRAWQGPVLALGPEGVVRLPEEEGGTYVRSGGGATDLDLAGELVFDWRDGDVL
ncbi:aminoglycoside 2'-N-acetyltransferase [Streptomyces cyaneogriseus subsp. noncyanogenus]|uniref:Aminoglycoside 2'-N-acetyltransferase n=1 Tax=Streptomyces cyaneogriseus subsp. noncyanogenus TaxID=477245 RepID=A0A0C5FV94_9ACTN|nr:GNAT family N-acetyltransferase [Streptomyces cyaneogriseus]AJP03962.1 aminoglycoside 2'-N-acetyltransferase [Streptomyces cyaneogriseus subsp. noncyanogenus]